MTIKNDQYFTNTDIVKGCWPIIKQQLAKCGYDITTCEFLEPAVGSGQFIKYSGIPTSQWKAFDIDTSNLPADLISITKKGNYLTTNSQLNKNLVIIGNPPFGKRSKLAIDFINKSLTEANFVAFILPVQFSKYLTQNKIMNSAHLIYQENLPSVAFHSPDAKAINHLRTGLYVFTNNLDTPDLRIRQKPDTTHPDFQMWQYNRTKAAEKYFDKAVYKWDFAVLRQGYGDYSKLYTSESQLNHKKQYIFFKAKNDHVLSHLKHLNFEKLSKQNTSIPGFGKADVVAEYKHLF